MPAQSQNRLGRSWSLFGLKRAAQVSRRPVEERVLVPETLQQVFSIPKNPWALHGRGRTLHSRGPGPQNPICLRARILRECKKNTKPGAQTLRSQPDWSRTKPGLVRVQTPPENSGPTPAYEGPGASGWFPILVNGQTDFQGPYIIDPSDSFHHHLLSRGERVAPISDDHEINPKTKQAVPST